MKTLRPSLQTSSFLRLLLLTLMTVGALALPPHAHAEANYVYHERTANNPGCGGQYVTTLNPNSSQSYTLRYKVECQTFTDRLRVYYTIDGSTPGGTFGTGNVGTLVVSGSYVCTFFDATPSCTVDVAEAVIPAQPAGTVVRYIVSAYHSGGGDEIFGNGCGNCGSENSSSASATVHQYTVSGATLFWDGDGTGVVAGGVGTWDTTLTRWSPTSGGSTYQAWVNANVDSATFGGTAATVTIGTGVTVNKITATITAYIMGGTQIITFSGSGAGVDVLSGGNFTLTAPYTGSLLTKTGAGRLTLNAAANTLSKYHVKAGHISTASANRFGTAPGALVADYLRLDGGGWGIDTGSQDLGATRGVTVDAGGAKFGATTATLVMTIPGPITGAGGITIGGLTPTHTAGMILQLNNTGNNYGGNTIISGLSGSAGILRLGASGVIPDTSVVELILSGVQFQLNGFDETVKSVSGTAGTIAVGVNTLTLDNPAGETYSSVFTASAGGKVVKNGTGTLILGGNSTGFAGEFVVNNGTIGYGSSGSLGNNATAGTITINGGKLSNTGTGGRSVVATVSVNLNADFTVDDSLFFSSTPGSILFSGPITIRNGNRTINVASINGVIPQLSLGGAVGEDVAGREIIKTGAGILALTGPNTYTGDTTILAGKININGTVTTPFGSVGTLHLSGGNLNTTATRSPTTAPVFNAIDVTADSAITTSSTASGVDLNLSSSTITAAAGSTLTFRDDAVSGTGSFQPRFSGVFTYAGKIAIANGAFGTTMLQSYNTTGTDQTFNGEISGTGSYKRNASSPGDGGRTIFTQANTYSGGTTVERGTLIVNNTTGSATGPGPVTINADGTLSGPGAVAGAVAVNGFIAPGASPGTISTGDETWNGGGSYIWEINDVNAGAGVDPGWDLININGTLTINADSSSKFNINLTSLTTGNAAGNVADFDQAQEYTWIIATASGGIINFNPGTFNLVTAAFSNPFAGTFFIEQNGNNVQLHYLPPVDLVLIKTGLPEPVGQGSNLTYTITINNSGPSTATAISLVDTLPPETTFVSASSGCTNVTGTVTCSLGDLPANGSTNVTIVVTANPCQGVATNMATVSSATADTDLANNSVTVTNTITDLTAPAIVCPTNLTVQCDTNVPPADFSGGSVTDNCDPNPTVSHVGDSSTGTNPKIITRTYKATDTSGNMSTCEQTITVHDTTAPALTACPANILVQDPENNGEVVTYSAPTATDNCDGAVSVNCAPASGSTFALGTNTVVCSAVDSKGNSNGCTFTVTVVLDCGLQAQIYVDDGYANNQDGDMVNFPDDGNPGPHTVGCDAFAAMQAGVDATASGGTMNVAAGTYPELLIISTPMTLLGANAGVDPRTTCNGGAVRGPESIIDGAGIETAIKFASSGIKLDGFTIQGGCCDAFNSGLHIGGFNDNHVQNNIIRDNSIGIFANCAGPLPTIIQTNRFDSNNRPGASGGTGIYVDASANLQILENEFSGHTDNHPLLIAATTAGAHTGLVVTENNFHDNAYGLYVLGVNGGTFARNQFSLLDGTCLAFFGGSSGVDVLSNLFVSLDASNTRGVRVRDDGAGLGNDIDIEIHGNSFTGFGSIPGTAFAVGNISGYTGTLDASANWWDVATPAGVPLKIDSSGGPVDYTPWLVTGVEPVPDVCNGFQGDFLTLEVDAASPQSQAIGRIQEGINLVTFGGTNKIVGGTYGPIPPESANASANSVTLAPGASPAQVVINGDMTLDSNDTLEFELNGTTPGTDYDQFVVNGMVTLGNATFSATAGFAYADCTTLTLIDNDSVDPVSGTFAGLTNGATVVISGQSFKIFYDGGSGNDVVLVKDTTGPTITCPANILVSDNNLPSGSEVVSYTPPTVTDNCPGVMTNCVPPSGNAFPVGLTVVTCTATDSGRNTATCSFNVVVCGPTPSTTYVDDDYANNQNGDMVNFPDDGNPGPHVVGCDAFATVQGGIAAVSVGGTVNVAAGSYAENVTLAKRVSLLGAQNGVDARGRVVGAPSSATESIIAPASGIGLLLLSGVADSVIDGFAFSGGTRSIESGSGPLDRVQIRNNHMVGFTDAAVFLNDPGTDMTIAQNVMQASSKTAGGGTLHLDTDAFLGLHVICNWIQNAPAGPGMFVDGNRNVRPSANRAPLILQNLFANHSSNVGINMGSRAFDSGTISMNTFTNNAFDGLQGGPKDSLIISNLFVDNLRWGLALTSFGNTTAGRGATNLTITCNTFTRNGLGANASDGAILFSAAQPTNNNGSHRVNFNIISGNSTGAVYMGSEIVNMENNWWGASTGPTHPNNPGGTGDAVVDQVGTGTGSGMIDYTPFLTQDTSFPTITCPANIAQNTDPGQCSAVVSYAPTVVSPTCCPGSTVVNCDPPSGTAFPRGTNTVTCSATNACGNGASCSFLVIISDTEPPMLSACPSNITTTNDTGQCSAVVTYTAPTATDNCTNVTVVCNPTNGAAFPVGTNTVTCLATDGAGNTNDCTFTVTVTDTEPPSIACPGPIVTNTAPGQCSQVVNFTVSSGDNCPGATLSCTPTNGATFLPGPTTVNCTAVDAAGNTNGCSFTVTVNDTERPSITCSSNIVVDADAGQCSKSNVTYTASASDNCMVTNFSCVPTNGSTFLAGTTMVVCTAADSSGNTTNCTFTVMVNDNENPVITCPTNTVVECGQPTGPAQTGMATATDNCDPNPAITSMDMNPSTVTTNTPDGWALSTTDDGTPPNTATAEFVNGPAVPPLGTGSARLAVGTNGNSAAQIRSINYNGALLSSLTELRYFTYRTQDGSGGQMGYIILNVDLDGNGTTDDLLFFEPEYQKPVYNPSLPDQGPLLTGVWQDWDALAGGWWSLNGLAGLNPGTGVKPLSTYIAANPTARLAISAAGALRLVAGFGVGAWDNFDGNVDAVTVGTNGLSTTYDFEVEGSGCVNSIARTWKATDASGNMSSCTQVIRVVDTTPPMITCPSNTTAQCGQTATNFTGSATATDNCTNVTISFSDVTAAGVCPTNTMITRTWKATDTCSNMMTCDQIITVVDLTPPVFTNCPASTNLGCNPISIPDCNPLVGATDNCGVVMVSCAKVDTTNGCSRTRTNTYTAVDGCNNTNTCTQVVTWTEDTMPPMFINCPSGSTNMGCNPVPATIPHCVVSVHAMDNCGSPSVTCAQIQVTNLATCVRTRTVTYTAVDGCNNTNKCVQVATWTEDTTLPMFTLCPTNMNLGCNPTNAIPDCDTSTNNVMVTDDCSSTPTITCARVDTTNGCGRTRTITYTAVGGCNNTNTCTQVVTWTEDTMAPVFTKCPTNMNLGCNPTNVIPDCDTSTNNVMVTEGCGSAPPIMCAKVDMTNGCSRTRTITYTAVDGCNNTNTCTQVINWTEDTMPPMFTNCPASTNLGCNPISIPDCNPLVGATDNCGVVVSCAKVDTTNGCSRTRTITYTAVDGCNNSNTCTQVVTWTEDTMPPMFINCPSGSTNMGCNPVPATIPHCVVSVTAMDNCGSPSVTCAQIQVTNLATCVRTRTVTYTAVDGCLNTNKCVQVATWTEDTTGPTITCPTNMVVSTDPGECSKSNVTYAATATDDCSATVVSCTPPSGSTFPVGTNTVSCTATDVCGNTNNCTFTVAVRDTEDPVITCSTNRVVECSSPSGTPVFFTTTATDNCTNVMIFCSMAPGGLFPSGLTTVECAAYDASSNASVCQFTVTVQDTTPPVLSCPSNMVVGCNRSNGAVVLYTVGVMDNCDSNVMVTCTPPSGSLFPQGTNMVMCSAVDQSGNSNSCSFKITVVEGPILLSIARRGTNVVLSWPVTCATYVLEDTPNLNSPIVWTLNPAPVVVSNNQYRATVPRNLPYKFFRLKQQP